MIINTESIKQVSNKILNALDTSEHTILTDTLEIIAKDKCLYFNVTNKEYYVSITVPITADDEFHATVNANMFLKLISQITTETVALSVSDKVLVVEGNGKFKIPLMLAFDKLMELPELTIDVVTQSFDISNDILTSITNFNSREIAGNAYNNIMMKSYYIDDKGCITYMSGACINSFTLEKPIKLVLGSKIVKLFKLFTDENIHFELGFNQLGENVQTSIRLQDSLVKVIATTYSTDGLVTKFPVDEIRSSASKIQPYNTALNRNELAQALNRFMIFSNYDVNDSECSFSFVDDTLTIENKTGDSEVIKLSNSINGSYKTNLDIFDLKAIIDTSKDQLLSISFGADTIEGEKYKSVVITRGNICNLLPECD